MSIKCTNPTCGAEIPTGSKFCGSCGTQAAAAEQNLDTLGTQVGDVGYIDGNITKTTQQGQASLGAINVTLGGQLMECPLCGRRNDEKNIFRCRECGIDHLCLEHLDRDHFVCLPCVKKLASKEQEKAHSDSQVVLCPLCGKHNKLLDTFQCQRCSKDHLCLEHHGASGNVCSTCLQEGAAQKAAEEAGRLRAKWQELTSTVEKILAAGELEQAERKLQELETFCQQHQLQFAGADSCRQLRQILEKQQKKPRPGNNFTETVTGMEMIWVPSGQFDMGGWDDEAGDDEKPVHRVELDGFWIGKFPVTQGQYQKLTTTNPSHLKKGEDFPVETMSWDDAWKYISELEKQTGVSFRLPTEAEWEYAARSGGKKEKYAGGRSVDSVAWYDNNSGSSTHRVGMKSPNGLGLYDMSGNVWEWCSDYYDSDYYSSSPGNNPQGPSSGSCRVLRGGSWRSRLAYVRAAYRVRLGSAYRSDFMGFRLVSPRQ